MAEHLSDEQVDNLVRLVDNIAAEQPYALDELVGTVERIREEAVLAWQATLDKTVDEANRQLAEAKAAGAAEVAGRVEAVLAELESRDLDPWYWSDAVEPIRAALTTGGEGRE